MFSINLVLNPKLLFLLPVKKGLVGQKHLRLEEEGVQDSTHITPQLIRDIDEQLTLHNAFAGELTIALMYFLDIWVAMLVK